jgi:molybdenum cofactor cytidylyltransferase
MPRAFAIVPAAGRSVRMGKPKLLLPWDDRTVIEAVLAAWQRSKVTSTVVVVHPQDRELAELCRSTGARVVVPPTPPPDMKASVMHALAAITAANAPTADDIWALAPADVPWMRTDLIDAMLAEMDRTGADALVPTFQSRRGHPVLFRWSLAVELGQLTELEGVNVLLERHRPAEFASPDDSVLSDLDTPEDFANALRRLGP